MTQAVSRRNLTAEVWVRFDEIPSCVCSEQNLGL
jgi:hypothetical protein